MSNVIQFPDPIDYTKLENTTSEWKFMIMYTKHHADGVETHTSEHATEKEVAEEIDIYLRQGYTELEVFELKCLFKIDQNNYQ